MSRLTRRARATLHAAAYELVAWALSSLIVGVSMVAVGLVVGWDDWTGLGLAGIINAALLTMAAALVEVIAGRSSRP